MSDQLKWGKLHVYLYDTFIRVYYWDAHRFYQTECVLNSDNSLHVTNKSDKLLPAMYWHSLDEQSDKIITYLMLKRN